MIITYVVKLYNNPKKNKVLHKQIDTAASIYNYCIEAHRRHYQDFGKFLDKYELQKELTRRKKEEEHESWNEVPSQAIQDITDRIDRGFIRFFKNEKARKNNKTKRRVSPPSFKKTYKYKSLTLKQAGYKLLGGNRIKIGNTIYKFSKSQEIKGTIKTVTIKRNALGEIFLYFTCEVPDIQTDRVMTGKIAGFDAGLKTFLTSSEGSLIKTPLFYKQAQKRITKANKNLSHKQKGSANYHKARLNYAREQEKVRNQRKDYHHKLARELALTYDVLYFEDLNIAAMQKLWGKKIGDLGFSAFINILKHACSKTGSIIHFIDRFYPSSKQCHHCFAIKEDLSLKDRVWQCYHCHTVHDRDVNAALNILREGASSLGLGNVRPSSMAISA